MRDISVERLDPRCIGELELDRKRVPPCRGTLELIGYR